MTMTRKEFMKLKDSGLLFEMCDCNHFGGASPNSVHEDQYQDGHGACRDCDCAKFTWKYFCDDKGEELK